MSTASKFARKDAAGRTSGREVRLKFVYVSVWSAARLALLIGCGFAAVSVLATILLWIVLNQVGAFDQVSQLFSGLSTTGGSSLKSALGLGPVLGFSAIAALLSVLTSTALGALGATLYNLSVRVTGGVLVGMTQK
ncbi:MAG: DUF3566 domain-containing protein [Microbacteriaceae bacterium]|nr:MAG: DUF3566 domain-containing protein [Microbacteriaceae bacterium]